MPGIRRVLAALTLGFNSTFAAASGALLYDLPPPYDGAYFDAAQPGIGLWLDNGPAGRTFGALMYYTPDGRPTFATFASPLMTPLGFIDSFVHLRRLTGPLYESVDGQCLGCPWRAPRSHPIAGDFIATLFHRSGHLRYAGLALPLSAMSIGRGETELIEGTWWLALDDFAQSSTSGAFAEAHALQAVVSITPVPGLVFAPTSSSLLADAPVREMTCIASCGDFDAWRAAAGTDARVLFRGTQLARYVETAAGLAASTEIISVSNVVPDPWAMHSMTTVRGASRLALYRSPRTAPCDGDALCRSSLDVNELPPSYASRGDRYPEVTRGLSGAFVDPAQPGTGLFIDAGRNGETFMTLMTYAARSDGGADPVFYTLGGPIDRGSIFATTATVRSPLYESRDGQRIAGAWRAPTTRVATELGTAVVEISSPARVLLTVAGQRYDMTALRPDSSAQDLPRGRWLLMLSDERRYLPRERPAGEPEAAVETLTAEVELVPLALRTSGSGSLLLPLQPSAAAQWYEVRCTESCGDFREWSSHRVGVYVEPDGHAVLTEYAVARGNYAALPGARQYNLTLADEIIDGRAVSVPGLLTTRILNTGGLRLHRNPPRAFCDRDNRDCR